MNVQFRIVGNARQRAHIMNGFHAGIPICCIAYFVTVHYPGGIRRWRRRRTEIMKALGARWEPRARVRVGKTDRYTRGWVLPKRVKAPQYVPCPACLRAKRFVRIHMCTKRCHPSLARCG